MAMIELLEALQEEVSEAASKLVNFQSFEGYKFSIIHTTPSEIVFAARPTRIDSKLPDRYFRLTVSELQ